jgi:hypothetical protein
LYILDGVPWDEPFGKEAGSGEDGGEEGGRVDASLEEEDVIAYTRDRLIPRLTPMVVEQRTMRSWRENEELRAVEKIQEDRDIYRPRRGTVQ